MELKLHQSGKKKLSKLKVSDSIFGVSFNEALVHQVLNTYMTQARAGTKAQKTRSSARGGGRKPWSQKGLGRARAGTSRSPIWRGGGVTFATRQINYSKKLNKKMYRGAMRSILSELIRQQRLICIDEFKLNIPKTKHAKEALYALGLNEVLIITDDITSDMHLATRNIPEVDVIDTSEVNPYSLIGSNNVLITKAVMEKIEAWLS